MAQRVVHLLEAVQIEKGHRHHLALALRGGDRPLEPVEEQQPVGDTGEVVVVDQMAQALLAAPLVRDVTACAAVVREASVVVEHRDAAGAQPDVAAGTVPEIFEVMELLTGSDRKAVPVDLGGVGTGCDQLERRLAIIPFGCGTGASLDVGRQPDEPVGCIGLPEPIRARGGEVAKPPLAPAQRSRRPSALDDPCRSSRRRSRIRPSAVRICCSSCSAREVSWPRADRREMISTWRTRRPSERAMRRSAAAAPRHW